MIVMHIKRLVLDDFMSREFEYDVCVMKHLGVLQVNCFESPDGSLECKEWAARLSFSL